MFPGKARIVEVFESIQGEGKYAGVSQIFVRFAGCNLRCCWCDSPQAWEPRPGEFRDMAPEELGAVIRELRGRPHSISLTGGEPLLHADFLKAFLPLLKRDRFAVYLETNGTLPCGLAEVIGGVDIISMDMKLPSSAECPPFWDEHAAFLRVAREKDVFVKIVVARTTSREDIIRSAVMISEEDPKIQLFLQPNHLDIKNGVVEKCRELQTCCLDYLADVRIMPQMHKFMDIS